MFKNTLIFEDSGGRKWFSQTRFKMHAPLSSKLQENNRYSWRYGHWDCFKDPGRNGKDLDKEVMWNRRSSYGRNYIERKKRLIRWQKEGGMMVGAMVRENDYLIHRNRDVQKEEI